LFLDSFFNRKKINLLFNILMTLTDQRHQKVNTRELVRVFFSEINQYNEKINAKSKSLYITVTSERF